MAERNVLVDGVGVALGTTTNPLQISGTVYSNARVVTKAVTYTMVGNGNTAGAGVALFQVSGTVAARCYGVITTGLSGVSSTSTISLGIASNKTGIISATQVSSCVANSIWVDVTPSAVESIIAQSIFQNQTIAQYVTLATISAGAATYYCNWEPLIPTSTVVAV